jgi:anti-sigma-K factor RskA
VTCAEFRDLAALYALGALDAAEQAAAEAHLEEAEHEGCLEALREASRGVVAAARSLPPAGADDKLWGRIESRLGAAPRAMGWRERAGWLVAVAAAVLLGAVFAWRAGRARGDSAAALAREEKQACARELEALRGDAEMQRAALALLESPTSRVVALAAQPGSRGYSARALVDLAQGKGMVISGTLRPAPGRDLELWVIRGQRPPVPAGLLRPGRSGLVLAAIDPRLLQGGADALAVSVEAQGGSTTGKPSSEIVLVGTLPRT